MRARAPWTGSARRGSVSERGDHAEFVFTRGRDKGLSVGRDEGIAPLVRVVSRRLGRDLSPEARSPLARHLDTPERATRLGDLVIDLSPADLAAWLANPDA